MSVYRLSFRILVILCASIVLVAAAVYTADSQEEKSVFRDGFTDPKPSAPMSPGTTPTTWSWFAETVDTGLASVCCYGDAALALDQSGHLHISYYDQANSDLKYAFKDADGWHISTLDEGGGKHSSIALDSDGYPHIVYWQSSSYSQCGVRYTYQDEAGWHVEVVADVDDACSLGGYTRLVLDSDGRPHISYGDYDQRAIIYGYRDSSGWHLETAASRAGKENSLGLDSEKMPHIAYYESYSGDLHYTYRDGTGWHSQKIDSDIDGYENISLKVDVNDYPHISYNSDWSAPSGECLRYAHQDASGWHTESVDCAGFHPGEGSSLSLDTGGIVHISYSGENGLTYAYQEGGGWHTETVDSYFPLDSSLVLENTGQRHIAYTSYTDGVLRYACHDIYLSINDVSMVEGDHGEASAAFSVTLSMTGTKTVIVEYATADGSATAPADYTAIPSTRLTFAPGVTSRFITVSVHGDVLYEPDEVFWVNLANPFNAGIGDGQGEGTILNDEVRFFAYLPLLLRNVGPPSSPPVLEDISNPNGHYNYTISWSTVSGATSYTLEEYDNDIFANPEVAYSGSYTSTSISRQDLGTYYYRVKASNEFGSSDWSNVESTEVTQEHPDLPVPGRWHGPSIDFTVTEDGRVGNARACTSCGCFNVSDYTEISSDGMWILTGASTTDRTQSIIGGFVSTTECIGQNVWVEFRHNQLYCYDGRDWTAHP